MSKLLKMKTWKRMRKDIVDNWLTSLVSWDWMISCKLIFILWPSKIHTQTCITWHGPASHQTYNTVVIHENKIAFIFKFPFSLFMLVCIFITYTIYTYYIKHRHIIVCVFIFNVYFIIWNIFYILSMCYILYIYIYLFLLLFLYFF